MADATITENVEIHVPGMEVVNLVVSDGETYTSKKFGLIKGAVVCSNDDSDAEINVEFSGAVATINWAGITDGNATLVLYGNLGN